MLLNSITFHLLRTAGWSQRGMRSSPVAPSPRCDACVLCTGPHMRFVPRVIALPGQHFSHFANKPGMTNQCVIHVFPPFQIRYSINTNSQQLRQDRCFYSELVPSPPGDILKAEQHWWDTLKVTFPQWDRLGDIHLPRRAASPGRRGCRSPFFHLAFLPALRNISQ